MTVRRIGITLALGVALTAASCSSDTADQAESVASDATSAASSVAGEAGDAVSEATGGANSEPTDAPVQELLLTPDEVTSMPMQEADPAMLAQAGTGFDLPEGMEISFDPPECADAADMNSALAKDVADGELAALMGGGETSTVAYTIQVLRTSISFDEYQTNWGNCENVQFQGQALGMSGTSTSADAPEIEGVDDVVARTTDTQVEGALGEGGRMATMAYLTEVRGVKVVGGAITAPGLGGEIGPEAEAELADLMAQQVAKINNAG